MLPSSMLPTFIRIGVRCMKGNFDDLYFLSCRPYRDILTLKKTHIPMLKVVRIIFFFILTSIISACAWMDSKDNKPYSFALTDNPKLPGETAEGTDPCQAWNNHVIAINRRGEFKPIKFEHSDACKKNQTPELDVEKHIDNILNAFHRSGKKRLMLFIHGGMNDYSSSLGRIDRDLQRIIEERAEDFPVFIVWPSEALDSYGDSIYHYYQGTWDHPAYSWTVPFKFATDLTEIGVRSLLSYGKQGNLWLGSRCFSEYWSNTFPFKWGYCRPPFREPKGEDSNPTYDPCADLNNTDAYRCVASGPETAKDFDFNFKRIAGYGLWPIKLAAIPIVDSLGYRDWYSQISRARFAFQKPCKDDFWGKGSCSDGVIKLFIERLAAQNTDTGRAWEITLIGHSMGAIVASEIIGAFPDLPYRNVVFIGAAVSIREFQNTVISSLARNYPEEEENSSDPSTDSPCSSENIDAPGIHAAAKRPFCFFNLSLHPYAEATEEHFGGAIPSGSLLEWIDANFESPANLSDRTIGRWANVAPLRMYFENDPVMKKLLGRYVSFKRFGLGSHNPHSHGGLADPAEHGFYWRPSYWYSR